MSQLELISRLLPSIPGLNKIRGFQITDVIASQEGFIGIEATSNSSEKKHVWIATDGEFNAPGFVSVKDFPAPETISKKDAETESQS